MKKQAYIVPMLESVIMNPHREILASSFNDWGEGCTPGSDPEYGNEYDL